MILLHGFSQTAATWARYPGRAPDLRGHGAAAQRRPATIAACVEDVLELADGRFALAGYSMGGRIALHVALAAPERVTRLVLLSTTAGIEDPAQRAARRAADEELAGEIERDGVEAFARRWAAGPLFRDQPAAVAAAAHADRLRNTASGLAAALRGMGTGTMEPVWHRLAELAMPATVVVGERDAKFRALGERLAAGLPRGALVVVPGAGHAVHLEAPEAVGALLREG